MSDWSNDDASDWSNDDEPPAPREHLRHWIGSRADTFVNERSASLGCRNRQSLIMLAEHGRAAPRRWPTHSVVMPWPRQTLNSLKVLGEILDQPLWWKAWTPDVPQRELLEKLVRSNPAKPFIATAARNGFRDELEPIFVVPSLTDGVKMLKYKRVIGNVPFPRIQSACRSHRSFSGRGAKEDNSGLSEENDSERNERGFRPLEAYRDVFKERAMLELLTRHHRISSQTDEEVPICTGDFEDLSWYVTMDLFHQRLCSVPLVEWTRDRLEAWFAEADREALERTIQIILSVIRCKQASSLETTKAVFPNESREPVLRVLNVNLERITNFTRLAIRDITQVLDLIVRRCELNSVTQTANYFPGPAAQTWLSDNAVPELLKASMCDGVSGVREKRICGPFVWLVDPSLYCGRVGETPVVSTPDYPFTEAQNATEHMRSILFANTTGVLKGRSKFQWLPCDVDVSEDGSSAVIRSYINGLHPEVHSRLYESIASVFARTVPLFDRVLLSLEEQSNYPPPPLLDSITQHELQHIACLRRLQLQLASELGEPPRRSLHGIVPGGLFKTTRSPTQTLAGSRCQVIFKIFEIRLTPDESFLETPWRVDGTDAEQIAATGLYVINTENVTPPELCFRMAVDVNQAPHNDYGLGIRLRVNGPYVQELGHVTLEENRCVVYPSTFQHKFDSFRLLDKTWSGYVRIMAFHLVDPDKPITSTMTIPPQQDAWSKYTLHSLLLRRGLPSAIVWLILSMITHRLSRSDAIDDCIRLEREREGLGM